MLTDENGNVVSSMYYGPYGEVLREFETGGNDIYKYKYTAQEEDKTTGLHYYKARFYDAGIGRFISADSIVGYPDKTQAYNKFMYVGGNPINYNDSLGNYWHVPGSEDLTTSNNENGDEPDDRPEDIVFNFNGHHDRVTGNERKGESANEKNKGLRFADRLLIHPTAVLHDHILAKHYQNESETYKWIAFAGVAALTVLFPVLIPFELAGIASAIFSRASMRDEFVSFGTMVPCFFIGTSIGIINGISLGIDKFENSFSPNSKTVIELSKILTRSSFTFTDAISNLTKSSITNNISEFSTRFKQTLRPASNLIKIFNRKLKLWQ